MEFKPKSFRQSETELVGFDVKVSSPMIAVGAVRRIYLRCRRKKHSLEYRNQTLARNGTMQDFATVQREALRRRVTYPIGALGGIFR